MADRILVVGGGTMGAGIALVVAQAGYDVDVVEPDEAARERAADARAARNITWMSAMPSTSDAVLAIEAVPERFELKRDVFKQLSATLGRDALLATNTSSFSVEELADVATNPARVVGLHFFNPPARMALVEVVAAAQTGDDAVERAFEIVERFGKRGVLAADTPGFIVNRVARPYYLQALRALELGAASVEELDALARGIGFRMGPFELMDLIGLDVNLATSESIFDRTNAGRFEPVALQRQMVAEGRLGRKTGAGFYTYVDGKAKRLDLTIPAAAPELNDEEIVALVGFGGRADELADLLAQRYARVARIEMDERLDELSPETTLIVDAGDGVSDRSEIIEQLDASFGPESVIVADAYVTKLSACAERMRQPQRLAGYGALGALGAQSAVEIVDLESTSDDTLELVQDLFAALGKASVLVEDLPALFLGRTIGSIVNEAMIAVADDVAQPEDVDQAMMLGANYPIGPIAWGREIGGARLRTILQRLADEEGEEYGPHRSLWVLDVDEALAPQENPQ